MPPGKLNCLNSAFIPSSSRLMPGYDHVDHVQVVLPDDAVQVHVEEVQARRRAPVSEQPWLDVLARERLAQERVVEQVDLPDGEVVRRAPERVQLPDVICGKRARARGLTFRGRLTAHSLSSMGTFPVHGC